MRLSNKAIEKLTVRTRNRLAVELDCSVVTVDRWIKNNGDNNDLTKAAALEVIREETGLTDFEILEEINEESKVS